MRAKIVPIVALALTLLTTAATSARCASTKGSNSDNQGTVTLQTTKPDKVTGKLWTYVDVKDYDGKVHTESYSDKVRDKVKDCTAGAIWPRCANS